LKKIEDNLLNKMKLRGIDGITKVFMRKEKRRTLNAAVSCLFKTAGVVNGSRGQGGYSEEEQEWVLDTEGCALLSVMAVEEVDYTRTTSNHCVEIFKVLGIEAARQSLLNEIRAVISFDGSYVNYHHLSILCDVMTFRGHVMSITRHGESMQ